MIRSAFLAGLVAASWSTSALAATLMTGPIELTINSVNENTRSISGIAGLDIVNGDAGEGTTVNLVFVDADTIDISFYGGYFGSDAYDLVVELTGLNYLNAAITGVKFNRGGSDIDEFIGDVASGQPAKNDFFEPTLAFTANSFSASFPFFHQLLLGDGPRLRYDLVVGTSGPAPVPLPASLPLLAFGLAAVAGLRHRKKRV